MAKRIGFDAYGAPQDTPDPMEHAIHDLVEHIHRLDNRIEQMAIVIQQMGGRSSEDLLEACESFVESNKKEAGQLADKGKSVAVK
jgi:serine O-acetyltransferase